MDTRAKVLSETKKKMSKGRCYGLIMKIQDTLETSLVLIRAEINFSDPS
jgi:hypothetical protein